MKKINPMRPPDPGDIVPGFCYKVLLAEKETKAAFDARAEYLRPKPQWPNEHQYSVAYANTLNDARLEMESEAEKLAARGQSLKRTSANRFYGSDGDMSYELSILAVDDPTDKLEAPKK